ncbi:MAG: DNA translocase FtsK 4TM domain-containing protein [Suipraeoptans sp.]
MAKGKTSRNKRKTTNKKATQESNFIFSEVIVWITLAVSVILLLGLFGIGGFIGRGIKSGLIYMFGMTSYIFPFLLFIGVAFFVSNKGVAKAYVKLGASCMLYVLCCIMFSLINDAGGKFGEIPANILEPAVGIIGSYVVVIVLIIICIVLMSQKSILKVVGTQSNKAYKIAKSDMETRRQNTIAKRHQKTLKRAGHRAEGVSFDTTLKGDNKSPEVKEVKPKETKPKEAKPIIHHNDGSDGEKATPPIAIKRQKPKMADDDLQKETSAVSTIADENKSIDHTDYVFPSINFLNKGVKSVGVSDAHLQETAMKLEEILRNFGVNVTVTDVSCGPSVTRYELQPEMGVKVSKIVGLADDIKLNLAAPDIRIEAPIPGKAAVGIEVPNKSNATVMLRELIESREFQTAQSNLSFAAGKDIAGKAVITDIAKMPHVLIAGATGSGKSVCINTLIMSVLYKANPDDVKFLMIDPKVVELSVYNGIPHLLIPVVTDPKKAAGALNWAVAEMTRRYQLFAEYKVRDMKGYNNLVEKGKHAADELTKMPQIIIIVDELADLMMVASSEVEDAIVRLAQLARAAGIHLVIATQRPSVNVITGLIKANMPSRIAFSVTSGVDSRTIIDMYGAEKLLGKGDMLFYPTGYQKPVRVQGAFVSDKEVTAVVDFLKSNHKDAAYNEEIAEQVNTSSITAGAASGLSNDEEDAFDAYFEEAGKLIIEKDKASIGMLQRAFKIGFNRAARIMDQLHESGVVGGEEGTKPRKIIMSMDEFINLTNSNE